jgi:hypothetical protein
MKSFLCFIALAILCPIFSVASGTFEPKASTSSNQILRIALKDGISSNETVIEFKKGYSTSYKTSDGDAPYSGGSSMMLSSLTSDSKNMSINFMPEMNEVSEIKLNVNAKISKSVTLNILELPQVPHSQIILRDKYLKTEQTVSKGFIYSFAIDKAVPTSFGSDRFSLAIKVAAPTPAPAPVATPVKYESTVIDIYPNPASSNLYIEANSAQLKNMEASVYTLGGILVHKSSISITNKDIDVSGLNSQSYIVVLRDTKTTKNLKVAKFLKQ